MNLTSPHATFSLAFALACVASLAACDTGRATTQLPTQAPETATAPAAPEVAPSPPRPAAVRGHVLGADGHALALAHVRLRGLDGAVLASVEVGADGAFELPIDTLAPQVAHLEASGVDHAEVSRLVGILGQSLELSVQLGTHPAPASLGELTVAVFDGPRVASRSPMHRGDDGRYTADIATTAATLRYEIDGLVSNGHTVNGTDPAASHAYDDGGDYLSIVPVIGGSSHIVVDPSLRPPGGAAPQLALADPTETSGHLDQVARQLVAAGDAIGQAMASGTPYKEAQAAAAPARAELARLIEAEDPLARRAALVAYFSLAVPESASEQDRAFAATAFAEIKPSDPIWALGEAAIANVVAISGAADAETAAYVAAFIDTQSATAPVASLMLSQLAKPDIEPAAAKDLLQRFASERFRATSYASLAREHDPERPLAVGKTLPAFEVAALAGKKRYTPRALAGKLYLIDLWATWCHPCMEEMPKLHAIYEKYGHRAKRPLHIVSISMDDDAETVKTFRTKTWHMPWEQAFPKEEQRAALRTLFGGSIPYHVLVDEKGTILGSGLGFSLDKLTELLDK